MFKNFVVSLITFYQHTLSPDHGPLKVFGGVCRFAPTCSEYTKQAVERFGVVKGLTLGIKRVSRCHPFNAGGVDLVPIQSPKSKAQNDNLKFQLFSAAKFGFLITFWTLAFAFWTKA